MGGVIFTTPSGDLTITSPSSLHYTKIFSHLWSFSSSDYLFYIFVRRDFQNSSRRFPGTLALCCLVYFLLKGNSYLVDNYWVSKGIHMTMPNSDWVTGLGGQSENSDYGLPFPLLCTLSASVSFLQMPLCTFRTQFLTPNTFHHYRHYNFEVSHPHCVCSNNKNIVYFTYSRTQLYFT